ncbi:MAG: SulP family inorganic anion transporter [Verrucomicrobiia bacterium]
MLVGLLLIAAAFLHVPTLIQYVSRSVVIGYMTGAALLIIANQLHNCLGFKVGDATTFFDVWELTLKSLKETRWQDLSLALFALGIYEGIRKHYTRWLTAAITLGLTTVIAQILRWAGAEVRFWCPPICFVALKSAGLEFEQFLWLGPMKRLLWLYLQFWKAFYF